jgi:NTP pyrophosphatase (non-canonical NTP hydrolase)
MRRVLGAHRVHGRSSGRHSLVSIWEHAYVVATHPLEPGRRNGMDLREIQQQVDAYIGQFKEGYFPPLVNLARLTEEVGELAREINHQYGPKTKKHDEPEGDIALELGDILFVVVVLANQLNIDLSEAAERTLSKYQVRDANRWERKQRGGVEL